MRKLVLVAALLLCASEARAQVEPRVAGDWQIPGAPGQPAKMLRIGSDGRFQMTSNGAVVDSGRITANEGAVTTQSDSGKKEQARFSVIGGALQLHGGVLEGSWSKGGSSQTQAARSREQSTPTTPVPFSLRATSTNTLPYTPAPPTSSYPAPQKSGTTAQQDDPRRNVHSDSRFNATPTIPANQFSYDTATTSQRASSQQTSTPQVKKSTMSYSEMFNKGRQALPGLEQTSTTSAQTNSTSTNTQSTKSKLFNIIKGSLNGNDSTANSNSSSSTVPNSYTQPDALQRYYGSSGTPKRIPTGGYIPVTKDMKARQIRFGK